MSWLYIPEQAGVYLRRNGSWAGKRFVMWKKPVTQSRLSKLELRTACWTMRRSGMMPTHSTGNPGVDAWISSLEASHANPSVWPGNEKERTIPVTDGRQLSGSFARFDPDTCSWRTLQLSLLSGTSEPFSGIWPRQGTMRNGVCYLRQPLERGISVKDYGLWPTPKARDWRSGGTDPEKIRTRIEKRKNQGVIDLPDAVTLNGQGELPTGTLNPEWVEWLMGWPIGWTALQPLEMDKFRQWLEQHGIYWE